ncbi:MAG: hypothetical protein K8T20_00100 [Planctomycetes bacterium]|nr:hypothetical protein [Planctomycetota bacterium]
MRPLLLALFALAAAGCSDRAPLVAEYGPDRRFNLDSGEWLRDATLQPPGPSQSHISDLEDGRLVAVVPGTHEVLHFARKDEDAQIQAWVELDGTRVVTAWLWAREFNGETAWFVGSAGSGTCRFDGRDPGEVEGTLDVQFEGRRESPRSGIAGPYVYRLKGGFSAKTSAAK